jgi:hypothetical protein
VKHDVRMDYARLGDKYVGEIYVQAQPTRGFLLWAEVIDATFVQLMTKLANCIREHAEVESVRLSRKELKDSFYSLDKDLISLFIKDPAAAIRSMTQPDRVVHVRDVKPQALLRAGTKTLADAFGDEVYIRHRVSSSNKRSTGECPFCGRWWMYRTVEGPRSAEPIEFKCEACSTSIMGVIRSAVWIAIPTQNLLDLPNLKFFLPRAWNGSGSWITREDLAHKLSTYFKEKSQCLEDLKA